MITVEQIKLPVGHTRDDLCGQLCRRLSIRYKGKCPDFEIIKRSLDARKKPDIFLVYSVRITEPGFRVPKRVDKRYVKQIEDEVYDFAARFDCSDSQSLFGERKGRPVVVGFGPAGMFCALELARAGMSPIVLERGKRVDARTRDVELFFEKGELNENSNVQFGEGGAGTFSDGKLNTGIGAKGGRSREVLMTFARHGAPEEILYDAKPHIGTDILTEIIKNIREEIIALGGDIYFNSCFEELLTDNKGDVRGCLYRNTETGRVEELCTTALALAIGHSARDTFEGLYKQNVPMEQKAFAVGVRIEHPQELIDSYVYGDDFKGLREKYRLPAGDYKLTAHTCSGRGVYSFCMCPGGYVVNSSSEHGRTAVNGMSYNARDGRNANSAIIASVSGADFGDGVLDGIKFQRELEEAAFKEGAGAVPVQLFRDFKANVKSSAAGAVIPSIKGRFAFANLNKILPAYIADAIIECMEYFDKKIPGFAMPEACLSGIESRTSSPVRINRNAYGMSEIKGLFPCGEGAGYAGGIMSSAVDGIKCAEGIISMLRSE